MKKVQRSFIPNWKTLFIGETNINIRRIKPGNFYRIVIYTYNDNKTRTLSGTKTAYIFPIGTYTNDGTQYLSAIKLTGVDPKWFMADIKMALDHKPLNQTDIVEAYENTESGTNSEFSTLLRKFPKDGKPLFNILKNKKRIYEGNYREYKINSIKSVVHLDIDPAYLKLTLTIDSTKQLNKDMASKMTNVRNANIAKETAKDNG